MAEIRFLLVMRRGTRGVFIGGFPSRYRAVLVAENLEWDESWKAIIVEV